MRDVGSAVCDCGSSAVVVAANKHTSGEPMTIEQVVLVFRSRIAGNAFTRAWRDREYEPSVQLSDDKLP